VKIPENESNKLFTMMELRGRQFLRNVIYFATDYIIQHILGDCDIDKEVRG
jgi:hypothetical protein